MDSSLHTGHKNSTHKLTVQLNGPECTAENPKIEGCRETKAPNKKGAQENLIQAQVVECSMLSLFRLLSSF